MADDRDERAEREGDRVARAEHVEGDRVSRAEDVEATRAHRAEDVESTRADRAADLEDDRLKRARALEIRTMRRGRLVAYLSGAASLIATAAAIGSWVNAGRLDVVERDNRQTAARRHETCKLFERQARDSIAAANRTQTYLTRDVGPADYGTSITRAVIRGLPAARAKAVADAAPAYCDQPHVGLAEKGEEKLAKPLDPDLLKRLARR